MNYWRFRNATNQLCNTYDLTMTSEGIITDQAAPQ